MPAQGILLLRYNEIGKNLDMSYPCICLRLQAGASLMVFVQNAICSPVRLLGFQLINGK
jgi:hypothetical protein